MRLFVIAMTVAGLVTTMAVPAAARHKRTPQKTETPAIKANDHDYKAALDRMPTPTQKYDPWGTMRPTNDKH